MPPAAEVHIQVHLRLDSNPVAFLRNPSEIPVSLSLHGVYIHPETHLCAHKDESSGHPGLGHMLTLDSLRRTVGVIPWARPSALSKRNVVKHRGAPRTAPTAKLS